MLLTYDELGGIAAIARWLDASQHFQRALDSFMSVRHVKQMFSENRFLNVTFAAEAFHRITQGEPYIKEDDFKQLLDLYVEHTPAEHHDWLRGRIEYGNEQPLMKRLRQLAGRSAVATRPLIGNRDKWAFTVAKVRNELTHLGSSTRAFDGSDLLYLAESVYAVARICMLLECGVSPDTLATKANAYHATWYRQQLKESIQKIRAQFIGK
jgi:hypothetical protein